MTKPRDDIQDLKRRLQLLGRLDGRAIVCKDGVFLFDPQPIRDPRPLVQACKEGLPPSAAIASAMGISGGAIAVTPQLLAAAHRDLRTIAGAPALLDLARDARRIFRRFGELDATWMASKRARLAELSELTHRAEGEPEEGTPPWFRRVLTVIGLVHGRDATIAVERAVHHVRHGARRRRAEVRRTFSSFLGCVAGEHAPANAGEGAALRAVQDAAALPGRSRGRRILAAVRTLLKAIAPESEPPALGSHRTLVEQVRAAGEAVLSELVPPTTLVLEEQAANFFAHYAMAFDPRPRDGSALDLSPDVMAAGSQKLGTAIEQFGGKSLTVPEVLSLLDLDLGHTTTVIGDLVAKGLPINAVQLLAALEKAKDLGELAHDVEAASAYADWVLTLLPQYRSFGLSVPISPKMFATFRGTRKDELKVLAACLLKHRERTRAENIEEAIAQLDATLGLFRRRPEDATRMLAELAGTSPGTGRKAFPEFADFLGDDALLDRYAPVPPLPQRR